MHDDYAEPLRAARVWALIGGAGDDADDVASEAVTRLWRRDAAWPAWPAPAARYAYLHRAVQTILIDRARADRAMCRAAETVSLTWQPAGQKPLAERVAGGDAEAEALGRLALAEALAALGRLGRDGRAVAMHAAGYTPREIAAALGLRPRTAYAALAAGRAALRMRT